MLNKEKKLLQNRGLDPQQTFCSGNAVQNHNTAFRNAIREAIVGDSSVLPIHPSFEIHPYKGCLPFNEQSKIIIGTFPPISYLIDEIGTTHPNLQNLKQPTAPHQSIYKPKIPFFHGNLGSLWKLLLTTGEFSQLQGFLPTNRLGARAYLINLLQEVGIYYDDIISSTQRKLCKIKPDDNLGYSAEDVNLKNICLDFSLIANIVNNADTDVVCFTNGATFRTKGLKLYTQATRRGIVRTNNSDAFSLFLRGCQDLGLSIELQCLPHYTWTPLAHLANNQVRTKLIFELRLTKGSHCRYPTLENFSRMEFTVITPFSPAAHGNIEYNPIVLKFREIHGQLSIEEILKDIYCKFRNCEHVQLYDYNIQEQH